MTDTDNIIEQAAAWHVASTADDMDWDGFTIWLEADARHRLVYDELALSDAVLGEHLPALRTAFDEAAAHAEPGHPARRHWRLWAGGALAASLAALIAVPTMLRDPITVYTTAGASRTVALADGSRIELAPRSRLAVDRDGTRITLDGGAWFAIRHDPARTLSVSAGPVQISDIGTVFDVQSDAGTVRVAVSEGRIRVAGDTLGQAVDVSTGSAFTYDPAHGAAAVRSANTGDVGGWRDGRLSFTDTPLALVADDLTRYAGVSVAVPAQLRDRRFSGTLVIGDGQAALRDLAQLMGLELRRDGVGYRLVPASR